MGIVKDCAGRVVEIGDLLYLFRRRGSRMWMDRRRVAAIYPGSVTTHSIDEAASRHGSLFVEREDPVNPESPGRLLHAISETALRREFAKPRVEIEADAALARATEQAEADRRFGQPHYGHERD